MTQKTVAVTVIVKVDSAVPLFEAVSDEDVSVTLKIGKTSRSAKIESVHVRGVK